MIRPLALLMLFLLAGCAEPTSDAPATAQTGPEPGGELPEPQAPSAGSIEFASSVPPVTRDATVTLAINVSAPALVTVAWADTTTQQDVEQFWNVTIDLAPGQTLLNVTVDNGQDSRTAQHTVVREVAGTVNMVYNGYPGASDSTDEIWINPDAHASAGHYEAEGAQHPGFANVHDLLVAWESQTGGTIDYGWSESFGFSVSQINGAGNPVTASAPPWWCYEIEGRDSILGITLEPFEPGMVMTWDLGTC